MRKIDRRILIVFSVIFILALAYGVMRYLISLKEDPPAFKTVNAARFVNADVIHYDEVVSPITEPGRMSSQAEINLSAEASGKIEQGDIQLKEGAKFSKGQIIFSIYKDEAELALKAKKSEFLNSLALLLPDISIDYPEYEEAFRIFFSAIDLDKKLPDFPEVSDEKLTIFLASKNILSEFYGIRKDELQLSRHVIRAPFDGTLSEVFQEVGAYTGAGGNVAKAIRTDAMELEVPLVRSDALWVKIGDQVIVESDIRSESWNGRVVRKGYLVDENTQSQMVYVKLQNKAGQTLLPGEFLMATFPGRPILEVMEIPRNAVFNSNEVFIVKNRRLQKQALEIVKVNTNTLLFRGATPGDTLVIQPLINVYEGTRVTTSLDEQDKSIKGPGPGKGQGQEAQKKNSRDKNK